MHRGSTQTRILVITTSVSCTLLIHAVIGKQSIFFTFVILRCLYDRNKPMELLKEMHRMLERQNEKIEYMHQENQEFRKKLSFLMAVRVLLFTSCKQNSTFIIWLGEILNKGRSIMRVGESLVQ